MNRAAVIRCEFCAACDPYLDACALQRLCRPGQDRVAWRDQVATIIPTIGPLRSGHVLVVPHQHVTSIGRLTNGDLDRLETTVTAVRQRLEATYQEEVLLFEYGLNVPGGRRVEHAHLHVVPTASGRLYEHVADRLEARRILSLSDLPREPDLSYIFIETQQGERHVFRVQNDAQPRLRLRAILAPGIGADAEGDWEQAPRPDLVQRTLDDLRPTRRSSKALPQLTPARAPGAIAAS